MIICHLRIAVFHRNVLYELPFNLVTTASGYFHENYLDKSETSIFPVKSVGFFTPPKKRRQKRNWWFQGRGSINPLMGSRTEADGSLSQTPFLSLLNTLFILGKTYIVIVKSFNLIKTVVDKQITKPQLNWVSPYQIL